MGRSWLRAPTRRREVTCPTCATANDALTARWCGHCGERLHAFDSTPRVPERSAADLQHLRRVVAPAFGLILILLLVVPAALRGGGGTPRGQSARGDATRSGVVADTAPAAPTQVAWELATSAPVVPPARVFGNADHAVVVNGNRFEVLQLATGQVIRTQDLSVGTTDLRAARPVGAMNLEPVQEFQQLMVATDLATGAPRWTIPVIGAAAAAAASAVEVEDDLVLLSSPGSLARLYGDDGHTLWTTDLTARAGVTAHRLVDGDADWVTLVTVSPAGARLTTSGAVIGGLAAVDPSTGRIAWTRELLPEEALAPIGVSREGSSGDGWIAHLSVEPPNPLVVVRDLSTGREQVTIPVTGTLTGLAVVGDVVVVSTDALGVVGHDATTGEQRWTSPVTPGPVTSARDGRHVTIRSEGATTLSILGVDDGRLVAQLDGVHPDVEPSFPGGLLAVATVDGMVAVHDLTGSRLWERPLTAPGLASLATDGELAVVNGQGGTVVLDGRTGEQVVSVERQSQADAPGIGASVLIDDGIVVASPIGPDATGRGLAATNADTGIARWNKDGDQPPVVGPITRADGLAWIPVGDEIHAYEIDSGRRAFAERGGLPRGALVVTDALVIAPSRDVNCPSPALCQQRLLAVARNRSTPGLPRDVVWTAELPVCAPVAVRDEQVFVPLISGIAAISVADGLPLWGVQEASSCTALAVADDVVVQARGTRVVAWARDDGTRAWSVELGQTLATDPVVAGSQVVVATADGDLVALDTQDGSVLWQYRLPAPAITDPVVVADRWVVLLRDGRVVGLR